MQAKTADRSADWMADLDDGLRLNEIVLPGTHDSATQYVQLAFFSKCQALSIGEQLEAGYRYLDIRLGLSDKVSDIILLIIILALVIIVAYPLYYVLVASVSNPYDVYSIAFKVMYT